jgi:hypothetical protein
VFYHQFLTSAIAVLFLASTHAPLHFSSQCRTEFYMALELVQDMSARSFVSQRLWRTIRSLKAYAPRLGLQEDDQRSGTAMTMAGLAMHSGGNGPGSGAHSPSPALPPPLSRSSSLGPGRLSLHQYNSGTLPRSPAAIPTTQPQNQAQAAAVSEDKANGIRLKSEMSAIFEGYMGLSGRRKTVPGPLQGHAAAPPLTPGSRLVASPEEVDGVYDHVRELF